MRRGCGDILELSIPGKHTHPHSSALMDLKGGGAGRGVSAGSRRWALPVEQEIQHLPGGGEGAVGAEEDGDVGGVLAPERRHHVLHQPLQRARLDGPHLAGLVEAQGRVRVHAQPPLALTGRLVELHLPQGDGEDGILLSLLADLLRRALRERRNGKARLFWPSGRSEVSGWNELFKLEMAAVTRQNINVKNDSRWDPTL